MWLIYSRLNRANCNALLREASTPKSRATLNKKCLTSRKSGGKPAFPTLRLLNLLDCFTLKAVQRCDHNLNSNQLGVRKVGLPRSSCLFVQSCPAL